MLENVRPGAQVSLGGNYSLVRFPRRTDAATTHALEQLTKVGLTHKLDTAAGDISARRQAQARDRGAARDALEDRVARRADGGRRLGRRRGLVATTSATCSARPGARSSWSSTTSTCSWVSSERVAVMYAGSIIAFDTPQRIMENTLVQSSPTSVGRRGARHERPAPILTVSHLSA
ncbi:MAG: hypothetical protein R2692_08270 [Microbacterium sp.]